MTSNKYVSTPVISVRGLTKAFPGSTALQDVDLDIYGGTIHALLGENGAGKSTLVKILYGVYTPDRGEVFVKGRRTYITSPREAIENGIVMVSQSPILIERLTVAENLVLSLKKYGLLKSPGAIYREFIGEAEELGVKIDPSVEVYKLTYTQKQLVEIIRALLLKAEVLILDEATTYLPVKERERLYDFLRKFVEAGNTAILITHKIPEALSIADRITVLRRGKLVGTIDKREASLDKVRRMMFGEKIYGSEKAVTTQRRVVGDEKILVVDSVWVKGDLGGFMVRDASLVLHRGEVLGIAGVTGNGQSELFEAVIGLRKIEKGRIYLFGVDATNKGPGFVRRMGVGFIPDNPLRYGLSSEHSVLDNIALYPAYRKLLLDWETIRRDAERIVKEYGIVTPSLDTPVKLLSGGNLMKVLVFRELTLSNKLLVAYNPTRGLDEYTAKTVRSLIRKRVVEGLSVLLASEDLDEIFELSDRIAVMNTGRIMGVFSREEASREKIEELMVV